MSKETSRKIWIGALATTGAVIFLASIFLIGKKQNMFGNTFRLNSVFQNVVGLKSGDYVRFSGVRAGIVDDISFVNDSVIVVRMKLDTKLEHLIKKDAVVFITTEGLVGNKIMEIKPRWKSTAMVNDNDTISSLEPFDTRDIIEKLLVTNNNAKTITANLARLSGDANSKKSILKTVLSDTVAANNFMAIITNLKTSSAEFSQMAAHLQKVSDNINLNKGLAGELFNDTVISKQLQLTISSLQQASANAEAITKQFSQTISQKQNTIGMLMKDTAVASDLKQSIENLKASARKLDESMDALQHNILLRGYFKKKKKENR